MKPENPGDKARALLEQLYADPTRDQMSPRERVKTAIDHRAPDRVPFDYWSVPEVTRKLQSFLQVNTEEELLRLLGVDIRAVTADYIGPGMKTLPDGTYFNDMGARKRKVINPFGTHEEYVGFPLAEYQTVSEIEKWDGWPRTEHWDWKTVAPKINKINRDLPFFIRFDLGCVFESAWKVYGLERFLTALIDKPEVPCAMMDIYTDLLIENFHNLMRHAEGMIDMVFVLDDIATQTGLLVSPAMWRRFILPRHKRLYAAIKKYDIKIMYHSCGSVYSMIGTLIKELPIDILNPLQPGAANMDLARIKLEYGNQLAFHGGIDIQHTMPCGTPEEVQAEVIKCCRVLGVGGGYICTTTHFLQMDIPLENIVAMYTAPR
jgi:uroporphyrinogen decarboxylase